MKSIWAIVSLIVLSQLCPANAVEMTAGGYSFSGVSVSETRTDNQYIINLEFTCRVKDGPNCSLLKVDVFLVNGKGDKASITAFVKDVGGSNSRLAQGVGKGFFSTPGETWRVESIYPDCQAR